MSISLTSSAIKDMLLETGIKDPIIQVLDLKAVGAANNSGSRYRANLSDGTHSTTSALFTSRCTDFIASGEVDQYSVIKVHKYMVNKISDIKKILVILDVSVLVSGQDIQGEMGNPAPYALPAACQDEESNPQAPSQIVGATAGPSTASPSKSNNIAGINPIASLTPYQNKWTICARVTSKSDIKQWSNSKGEGKLFSVNLLDASSEIRATAFTNECDKFFNLIEIDKLYYISGGVLKTANKRFTSLNNEYEITFNPGTTVVPCNEESAIPKMKFDFVPIGQLEQFNKDDIIDVIGICKSCNTLSTVQQRSTGKELTKRDVQIVDESNNEVCLTFWGSQAENFDGSSEPVIAAKGVRVSDFGGRCLSILANTTLKINPDIKEAHRLRAWYDNVGTGSQARNLSSGFAGSSALGMGSNFLSFFDANLANLGACDADYYTAKAYVCFIRRENCAYQACPGDGCNKKIIDLNNGSYKCEKCNREYDNFNWRLILSANISDYSENAWVTLFQEQAEAMLGVSVDELISLRENDSDAFGSVFQKAAFREFVFKLKVKMETFNDERRLKTSVVSLSPVNYSEYNQVLLKEIKKMME